MPRTRPRLPDELVPHSNDPPQTFIEGGPKAGDTPEGSTKVGWTLRNKAGRITAGFAFLINPQGINRVDGSRSTLAATKGGFYVDDFGGAPTQITLRQLVASGKVLEDGDYYTGREDVHRFIKTIFLPATTSPDRGNLRVYFHDHHFERGFEQRVFFPANALAIQRSVDQHGLWLVELSMIGLERNPYAEVQAETIEPRPVAGREYRVKRGDTIDKIVRRVAGKRASDARRKRVRQHLLTLNPTLRQARFVNGFLYKPMKVYPGEIIRLPVLP